MSILDKHPAPWRHREEFGDILDANGEIVATAENGCGLNLMAAYRLILAAPELLAALNACPWLPRNETRLPNGMIVPGDYKKTSAWLDAAEALIARIEGGK